MKKHIIFDICLSDVKISEDKTIDYIIQIATMIMVNDYNISHPYNKINSNYLICSKFVTCEDSPDSMDPTKYDLSFGVVSSGDYEDKYEMEYDVNTNKLVVSSLYKLLVIKNEINNDG